LNHLSVNWYITALGYLLLSKPFQHSERNAQCPTSFQSSTFKIHTSSHPEPRAYPLDRTLSLSSVYTQSIGHRSRSSQAIEALGNTLLRAPPSTATSDRKQRTTVGSPCTAEVAFNATPTIRAVCRTAPAAECLFDCACVKGVFEIGLLNTTVGVIGLASASLIFCLAFAETLF